MKKTVLAALVASAVFSSAALADGWKFAPLLTDKSFKLEPTVAVTVNSVNPDMAGMKTASAYGIDFNFNCGLLQDPQNRMRTHLNISSSDKDGVEVMAYELSPRYTVPMGNGLSVGVGPSLAVFKVEDGAVSESYFGVGVAAGVNYRAGAFYAGADVRWHDTSTKNDMAYDNVTVGAKVGMNF